MPKKGTEDDCFCATSAQVLSARLASQKPPGILDDLKAAVLLTAGQEEQEHEGSTPVRQKLSVPRSGSEVSRPQDKIRCEESLKDGGSGYWAGSSPPGSKNNGTEDADCR